MFIILCFKKMFIYLFIYFIIGACAEDPEVQLIEVPEHGTVRLKCYNKSEGSYQGLFWSTEAYSNAPYSIYSVGVSDPETISSNYKTRLKRDKNIGIVIWNVQYEDSGTYRCYVLSLKNIKRNGSISHQVTVNVLATYKLSVISPPTISEILPSHPKILRYSKSTISCVGKSLSPFSITWQRSGQKRLFDYNVTYTNYERNSYYISIANITLFNMTRKNIGKYICVAQNIGGMVTKKVKVHMQVVPEITTRKNFRANIGEIAKVNCTAVASPKPIFTWTFFAEFQPIKLQAADRHEKFLVTKTIHEKLLDGIYKSTSSLIIEGVNKNDWMLYNCLVENEVGFDQRNLDLTGYSVPDQPEILYAKGLDDQATIYWDYIYNGGKTIDKVTLEYKQDPHKEWKEIIIHRLVKQYTIKELQPLTKYIFRVKLHSSIGESKYSDLYEVSTTTLKVDTKKSKKSKKTKIGPFTLTVFICICGGVLIAITVAIGVLCLIFQSKKKLQGNRKTKQDEKEAEDIEMRNMNNYATVL